MNRSMSNAARALALVPMLLGLQGCLLSRNIQDQAQVDPAVSYVGDATLRKEMLSTTQEWIEVAAGRSTRTCERSRATPAQHGVRNSGSEVITCHVDAIKPTPPRSSATIETRNDTQSVMFAFSDQVCEQHLAGVFGTAAAYNVELGGFTSIFAGAASIVSGQQASNLAAGATVLNSMRSLFNSEIYQGMLAAAILAEIRGVRKQEYVDIIANRTKSIADYPPADAVNDVLRYHNLCSFNVGVSNLVAKAGVTSRINAPWLKDQAKADQAALERNEAALVALAAEITKEEAAMKADAADKDKTKVHKERLDKLYGRRAVLESLIDQGRMQLNNSEQLLGRPIEPSKAAASGAAAAPPVGGAAAPPAVPAPPAPPVAAAPNGGSLP